MKRRIIAMLLAILSLVGVFISQPMTASAATSSSLATRVKSLLPIVCYATPASGAKKIDAYSDYALTEKWSKYWINSFSEEIVITDITSNGKALKVRFLDDYGKKVDAWFKADDVLGLSKVSLKEFYTTDSMTIYRMKSKSSVTKYGSVYDDSDGCWKLGRHAAIGSKNYELIVYKLSNTTKVNGISVKRKMGLVTKSAYKSSVVEVGTAVPTGLTIQGSENVKLTGKGDTVQLTATLKPQNASGKISWTSSNKKVATVDTNGLVTSTGVGSCTISASVAVDTKNGTHIYADTIKLTVEKEPEKKVETPSFDPVWPCDSSYYISTMYYYKNISPNAHGTKSNKYNGFDIQGTMGDTIYAVEKGTVVEKGCEKNKEGKIIGWGYYLIIEHENGLYSFYAHLREDACVNEGDTIKRKQEIGYMGSTGNSTGPHLHFEIFDPKDKSVVINPWATYYQAKTAVTIGGNSYDANYKYSSTDTYAEAWCKWLTKKCKESSAGDYVYTP